MTKSKSIDYLLMAVIGAIFLLSISTLTKFPDPYFDEGMYAAFGAQFAKTGSFNLPEYNTSTAYSSGSSLVTRVMTSCYAAVGHFTGYNLATARSVSMIFLWFGALLWFFISRRVGVNGWLGVLLFVSTERLFYASHAFRPEMSLALANTFFLFFLTQNYTDESSASKSFKQGLINFFFVAAHGNGIASVAVNCFDMLTRPFKNFKRFLSANFFYYFGSLLAAITFYFVQLHGVGGLGAFHGQVAEGGVYHKQTIMNLIRSDIQTRWGRELIVVGGSSLAKLFRFYFYFVMVTVAIYNSFFLKGLAKRSGILTLVCILGYIFLVWDKVDIHFAEMMPFFLFSFMCWFVAVQKNHKIPGWVPKVAFGSIIFVNLLLVFHHGIKYQGKTNSQVIAEEIEEFLASEKIRPASEYNQFVGQMQYWFWFHDRMQIFNNWYAGQHTPFHGGVIVTDSADSFFVNCHVDFTHPEDHSFSAYYCP